MSGLSQQLGDVVVGLDHVAVAVTDLESAIGWYRDMLGFTLIERRTTRGERTGMISAVMRAGSAIIVLIQSITTESQVDRFIQKFGPGVQHLALAVTDLDTALERFRAAGGSTETEVVSDEGIRQVFLQRDSRNGVRVELIHRRGGTFSDRSVERIFRAFEEGDLF